MLLEKLTEGVVIKNMQKEVTPLITKWSKIGLLEGLKDDNARSNMARLLENQAKELLRESSGANALGTGDIQGFAAVAFPLVRRVFGSLIANELVSVQPMSLPSGMIFFMDFIRNNAIGMASGSAVFEASESIYGGGRKGAEITKGIILTGSAAEKGLYNIAHGYHKARRHAVFAAGSTTTLVVVSGGVISAGTAASEPQAKLVRFDPDILQSASKYVVVDVKLDAAAVGFDGLVNEQNVFAASLAYVTQSTSAGDGGSAVHATHAASAALGAEASEPSPVTNGGLQLVRRLSTYNKDTKRLRLVIEDTNSKISNTNPSSEAALSTSLSGDLYLALSLPVIDGVTAPTGDLLQPGTALGILKNTSELEGTDSTKMPELRIFVNSMMISTEARKLRASWTPELSQDLNAYHNIDAEVELTNLLSEQISQEIDQMLLNDLVKGATAGTYYWSRRPGKFVNRATGSDIGYNLPGASGNDGYAAPPDFTGNVSMWYETLIETINDVSAQIMRKTLRGGATFLVTSPEVANILEFTAGFRASATHSEEKGSVGVVNVGSISKKFDVMVSTYFPRNVILVGRKGSGFLESGYVYSPYVPLQMTPTVFDPDNFTPRKAVMTRFGRKMVRPDMYGLVIVQDLLG